MSASEEEPLTLPNRFETLRRRAEGAEKELSSIVVGVDDALAHIDKIYADMQGAGSGAFLVLRGDSGAGKTTFLHTVGLFRKGVKTLSVPPNVDIRGFFKSHPADTDLTIYVLEEREAAVEYTDAELESLLHAVNAFIRSDIGEKSLVVWPCNTDELRDRVVNIAERLGSDALLGSGEPSFPFSGPQKSQFRLISQRTVDVLNESASFSDLGVTDEQVDSLVFESKNIGAFLGKLRGRINENKISVNKLLIKEHPHLWVVVLSGDEPEKDVSSLTRGQHASIDIERLMSATDANVVQELKKQPERLGILGSVLDAKIFHMPVLTSLAVTRAFADEQLKAKMREKDLALTPDDKAEAVRRLNDADLAKMLNSGVQGRLARGAKIGNNTEKAFAKLAEIARTNDQPLNKALGAALLKAGLITAFETEQDFGDGMTRRTDLVCQTKLGVVRVEMMWRSKTSRAEIANYVLGKLQNYGKAIGFLK